MLEYVLSYPKSFIVIALLIAFIGMFLAVMSYRYLKDTRALNFVFLVPAIQFVLFKTTFNVEFLGFLIFGLLPDVIFFTILYMIFIAFVSEGKKSDFFIKAKDGSKVYINNILRGLALFGSAGSGKTYSVVMNLLKYFIAHKWSGIIYDFKNFELASKFYTLFDREDSEIDVRTICFHQPNLSDHINPIAPELINNQSDVIEMANVLYFNLSKDLDPKDPFWKNTTVSALSAVIWKLYEDHPQYCSLPYVLGVIIEKDIVQLYSFIESNLRAKVLGKAFLESLKSKTGSNVLSNITSGLSKIAIDPVLILTHKSDFSLKINNPDHPTIVVVVNDPKNKDAYSPIIALCCNSIHKQIQVRNQNKTFLLYDEMQTLFLPSIQDIPATLRSFGVATICVFQDKVQGVINYTENIMKALMANLSYRFLGSANEPDTAEYYARMFGKIDKVSTSKSKSTDIFKSNTRLSESEREKYVYEPRIFTELRQGEFVVGLEGGEHSKKTLLGEDIPDQKPKVKNYYTDEEIRMFFDKVFRTSRKL